MLASEIWPLFGLRVRTPRVDLIYPSDDSIGEIAHRSAVLGIHDPAVMPFEIEWTDVAPPLQQRLSMQHHWDLRAAWKPSAWTCNMAVTVDDRIVGTQSAAATDFATTRTAHTGSFLFLPEQGRGIGTEMRAAILHLLFAGLDAEFADTAAWSDNAQSLGVSAKLGYELQGSATKVSRGAPREQLRFRLSRAEWETRRRDDIRIEGLEPCLDMFGLTTQPTASESMGAEEGGSPPPAEG